uniref:Uncharacterized protein n=1 Tax=Pyramimonas orientalis virus TaxID=455367 RepID=A0A7M3UNQ3_POV01|nr:hypothetical protein HWQ62_00191 [Pyramimonas orientalis virus]
MPTSPGRVTWILVPYNAPPLTDTDVGVMPNMVPGHIAFGIINIGNPNVEYSNVITGMVPGERYRIEMVAIDSNRVWGLRNQATFINQ